MNILVTSLKYLLLVNNLIIIFFYCLLLIRMLAFIVIIFTLCIVARFCFVSTSPTFVFAFYNLAWITSGYKIEMSTYVVSQLVQLK